MGHIFISVKIGGFFFFFANVYLVEMCKLLSHIDVYSNCFDVNICPGILLFADINT